MNQSIDRANCQVEMSLRSQNGGSNKSTRYQITDYQEGDLVDGKVKRIESYGLFIEIVGTGISGLCHKSEVRLSACRDPDV